MRFPALLLAALLGLTACGYHLGEIRPTPMRSVRSLAVPNFKNSTTIPRLESLFADTMVKKLQQDGTYEILNSAQADAVLNCTITSAVRRPLRAVQNNVLATAEFGVTVTVRYEVVEQSTGAVLMGGTSTGSAQFFSGNDLVTIQRQAMSDAAANLADNLAAVLTEGW